MHQYFFNTDYVGYSIWIPNLKRILSDSKSCLQAIDFIILQIKQILYKYATDGFDITLAWVPGHSDISGNEVLDRLAKEVISSGLSTHNEIFSHDPQAVAKVDLFSNWNKLWARTRWFNGKYSASNQESIPINPWFFCFHNSSIQITSTISRLRLNHVCTVQCEIEN